MNKFQRSWLLFKSSITVILHNKILLVFPVLTVCLTLPILGFFIAPIAFQQTGYRLSQPEHWKAVGQSLGVENTSTRNGHRTSVSFQPKPVVIICTTAVYFVSMFLATFFNVAFYSEILAALKGDSVSIQRGLAFACSKWWSILLWSAFAGLIGYLIRQLEERMNFLGRIIVGLIGTAWSVACIFVIPVLVSENETVNPLQILKKSAQILTKTWGESLIGYAGIQFGGTIVMLGSLLLLGGSIAAAIAFHMFWLIGLAVLMWFICICAWSYVIGVASQVYRCALFLYASEGVIVEPYNEDLLNMAWKVKDS